MAAHDEMAWIAERVLHHRRQRKTILPPDLFSEHGWEALLHLFIADAKSERRTGDQLAALVGISPRLMTRWVKYLGEQKLIDGDGHGEMEVLLTLSPTGLHTVEEHLSSLQSLGHDFAVRQNGPNRPSDNSASEVA